MRTRSMVAAGVALAALSVVGCGKKRVAAPRQETLTLAGKQASYRVWSREAVCQVEPRWLQGDFESMNALVGAFLAQTSAAPDATWNDEQIAVLDQSTRVLLPALDATQVALEAVKQCGFASSDAVSVQAARFDQLSSTARKTVAQAPFLLPVVTARADLVRWKAAHPAALAAGKEKCTAKPKSLPGNAIYHAFEDELGHSEWLFCDGSKVTANPGGKAGFVAPVDPAVARRVSKNAKKYLDAAVHYPVGEVSRAPRIPSATPPEP